MIPLKQLKSFEISDLIDILQKEYVIRKEAESDESIERCTRWKEILR